MSCQKHGSASQSAALDLLLKTFTNPSDIFTQNSIKHQFETISRIVPGTTPRQCTRRWEELRSIACKCDNALGSTDGFGATEGKPLISEQRNSHTNSKPFQKFSSNDSRRLNAPNKEPIGEPTLSCRSLSGSLSANGSRGGGPARVTPQCSETELSTTVCPLVTSTDNSSREDRPPITIIHVFDEAKKMKQDFACPRDVLVREMKYFAEYLLPSNQNVEDMDISVHCDITVFDWLMRYTKRGMREGPGGEPLSEPQEAPRLEVTNAASILISSDFLQMEALVEECLDFFHNNISQIVSLSASSINSRLMSRLVAKFTPSEVEQITDKKEKLKRKMYAYMLEQFFDKGYYHPDCPKNGFTLYRHCGQLLTVELQELLPCTPHRMVVCFDGSVSYQHQRDAAWAPATAVKELQHNGYSLREIFWWFWGAANWLVCQRCGKPFKCNSVMKCAYHVMSASSPAQPHQCCSREPSTFSLLPCCWDGCTFQEHIVQDLSTAAQTSITIAEHSGTPASRDPTPQPHSVTKAVHDTLQAYKDVICLIESEGTTEHPCAPDRCWLLKECGALPDSMQKMTTPSLLAIGKVSNPPSAQRGSSQQAHVDLVEQSMCSYDGATEEEDGYMPKAGIAPKTITSNKSGQDPSSYPLVIHQPLDWTWDSTKSRRWNQDLQRESDEQRLHLLIGRTQNVRCKAASPKKTSKNREVLYGGGIFCRLEAQFKAQHTTTATSNSHKTQASSGGKK